MTADTIDPGVSLLALETLRPHLLPEGPARALLEQIGSAQRIRGLLTMKVNGHPMPLVPDELEGVPLSGHFWEAARLQISRGVDVKKQDVVSSLQRVEQMTRGQLLTALRLVGTVSRTMEPQLTHDDLQLLVQRVQAGENIHTGAIRAYLKGKGEEKFGRLSEQDRSLRGDVPCLDSIIHPHLAFLDLRELADRFRSGRDAVITLKGAVLHWLKQGDPRWAIALAHLHPRLFPRLRAPWEYAIELPRDRQSFEEGCHPVRVVLVPDNDPETIVLRISFVGKGRPLPERAEAPTSPSSTVSPADRSVSKGLAGHRGKAGSSGRAKTYSARVSRRHRMDKRDMESPTMTSLDAPLFADTKEAMEFFAEHPVHPVVFRSPVTDRLRKGDPTWRNLLVNDNPLVFSNHPSAVLKIAGVDGLRELKDLHHPTVFPMEVDPVGSTADGRLRLMLRAIPSPQTFLARHDELCRHILGCFSELTERPEEQVDAPLPLMGRIRRQCDILLRRFSLRSSPPDPVSDQLRLLPSWFRFLGEQVRQLQLELERVVDITDKTLWLKQPLKKEYQRLLEMVSTGTFLECLLEETTEEEAETEVVVEHLPGEASQIFFVRSIRGPERQIAFLSHGLEQFGPFFAGERLSDVLRKDRSLSADEVELLDETWRAMIAQGEIITQTVADMNFMDDVRFLSSKASAEVFFREKCTMNFDGYWVRNGRNEVVAFVTTSFPLKEQFTFGFGKDCSEMLLKRTIVALWLIGRGGLVWPHNDYFWSAYGVRFPTKVHSYVYVPNNTNGQAVQGNWCCLNAAGTDFDFLSSGLPYGKMLSSEDIPKPLRKTHLAQKRGRD